MHWILLPLRRYADFRGRSRRREYWLFGLFTYGIATVLFLARQLADDADSTLLDGQADTLRLVLRLFVVAMLLPWVAVHVRRYHDQEKSGWLFLLTLIPGIGLLISIYFMTIAGTAGENRFGPDPKSGVPGA